MATPGPAPDPATCPRCSGRMRVLSTRRAAGGALVTRYRLCPGCGTRTTDRHHVISTPIGRPRVLGAESVPERTDFDDSAATVVPAAAAP